MKKVNILTQWFNSPNGCAFLFPLIKHRQALKARGIEIKFFSDQQKLTDADVIIADSKYFSKQWIHDTAGVIASFERFRQQAERVLFFDINDSSGWPHARILPYVDAYVKNQLLVDKTHYLQPLYGHRFYTDYYHHRDQVCDTDPSYSEIIEDPALLTKLKIGWNSGLADYSLRGPYRMMLYNKLSYNPLLSFPRRYYPSSINRARDLSCRMGIHYARNSVAWQRRQIQKKLQKYLPTEKVSRRKYFRELIASKVVISPFGLGEITLKDFEVFITGGLLLKPDLSHMHTWPNWYQSNQTIVTYQWDLSDLEAVIETVLANYSDYVAIARAGQDNYRKYLIGDQAAQLFCEHFIDIIGVGA